MSWFIERKYLVVLLAVLLLAVAFAACSDDDGADGDDADASSTTTAVTDTSGSTVVTGLEAPESFSTAPARSIDDPSSPDQARDKVVVGGQTKEEYEASIPELEKRLESSPDDLAVLAELAVAQYQTARYDDAVGTYKKMLEIEDQPLIRNNYANVLRDAGRKDEAKEEYEKAITADPALTVAYVNLATTLMTEDKKEDALSVLDRGIANTAGEDQERLQAIKEDLSER